MQNKYTKSASGSGGCGFKSRPHHTKKVLVASLLSAQHYKASTGFSSLNTYRTTNFATLEKIEQKLWLPHS